MLTVTDNAAKMILALAAEADLPEGAGLRIADAPDRPGLQMALVDRPAPEDEVLLEQRAVVFLDPPAMDRLAEATLDARSDERGSAFFLDD